MNAYNIVVVEIHVCRQLVDKSIPPISENDRSCGAWNRVYFVDPIFHYQTQPQQCVYSLLNSHFHLHPNTIITQLQHTDTYMSWQGCNQMQTLYII